jgi:hypothetical protein
MLTNVKIDFRSGGGAGVYLQVLLPVNEYFLNFGVAPPSLPAVAVSIVAL